MPDNTTILLVLTFVAVLLLVEGVSNLLLELIGSRGAMNRRLRLLARGLGGAEVMATLRRNRPDESSRLAAWLLAQDPVALVDGMLSRAGMSVPTLRCLAYVGGAVATLALTGLFIVKLAMWKAVLVAVVFGMVLPAWWLHRRGRARLIKLAGQLPDAIDMIVRSLRAGHPVASAISMVAREMPDPIGSEFGLVFDEMTYGLDLRAALDNLASRVPVQDLHYMIVAVRIQYGTGGNLAEVLAGLSRVIRDRHRMRTRIRALSAEGRMSATILSALPFVLAGLIFLMRPNYYFKAMEDPAFLPLIAMGLFGIALGIVAMHRIVNFRF